MASENKEQDGGIEIRPFRGYVPSKDDMIYVQSPPYDVVDSEEALALVNGLGNENKKKSFLHVNKPEIDVSECMNNIYDDKVYAKGKENLENFIKNGYLVQAEKNEFYIYGQEWKDNSQYGLVCEVSSVQYGKGLIKKHELTRAKKEEDRTKLTLIQAANVGPVFLCYKENNTIDDIVKSKDNSIIKSEKPYSEWKTSISNKYLYKTGDDQKSDDNDDNNDVVTHKLWRINDESIINKLINLFSKEVPCLYVADGHHRTKAAFNVMEELSKNKDKNDKNDDYKYFMAVLFPSNELTILDYNRVIKFGEGNLENMTNESFLTALKESKYWNDVEKCGNLDKVPASKYHEFRMYVNNEWYLLRPSDEIIKEVGTDVVLSMDTSILSNYLLDPILGIKNIRKSENIKFVGGIHGLSKLAERIEKWTNNKGVAFALHATSVKELMNVADANKILPPKSTWFEPKLRSGVVVRKF